MAHAAGAIWLAALLLDFRRPRRTNGEAMLLTKTAGYAINIQLDRFSFPFICVVGPRVCQTATGGLLFSELRVRDLWLQLSFLRAAMAARGL